VKTNFPGHVAQTAIYDLNIEYDELYMSGPISIECGEAHQTSLNALQGKKGTSSFYKINKGEMGSSHAKTQTKHKKNTQARN